MAAENITHRNERRLFALGLALAAAFFVDAAFVDLEPGATVTSHPWALTTLALLGTIAAAHRRLPRGVRFSLEDVIAARLGRRRRAVRLNYA